MCFVCVLFCGVCASHVITKAVTMYDDVIVCNCYFCASKVMEVIMIYIDNVSVIGLLLVQLLLAVYLSVLLFH